MPRNAIGLIEVVGMAAALAAADAAVKSANVQLLGYEKTKGGGMITIKFEGDVGAVKAALDAASVEAGKVNRVVSKHFIPRPSDELEKILPKKQAPPEKKDATQVEAEEKPSLAIENKEEPQEIAEPSQEVEKPQEIVEASLEVEEPIEEASQEVEAQPSIEIASSEESEEVVLEDQSGKKLVEDEETIEEEESSSSDNEEAESDHSPQLTSDQEVCNICKDPACTRRKGDARTMCIHYHATIGGK